MGALVREAITVPINVHYKRKKWWIQQCKIIRSKTASNVIFQASWQKGYRLKEAQKAKGKKKCANLPSPPSR
jgi:hypothetical protein